MVLVAFAALSVLLAAVGAVTDSLSVRDVLLFLFWLAFLPIVERRSRHAAARAREAEVAAEHSRASQPDVRGRPPWRA